MLRSFSLLIAGVAVLGLAGSAKADDDLVRLDGKGDAEVTEAGYYRGGWGGGYRGGWGGYRGYYGGWGRGYYGGWGRGYYGGWGRGYYGGWGRGYYGGWGVGIGLGYGGYYGGYYPSYYYPSYYAPSYYSAPCTCSTAPLDAGIAVTSARPASPRGDGTFPYDGGPRDAFFATLPPGADRPAQKRDGLFVSVPAADSGYRFLAFGEQPGEPAPRPADRAQTVPVSYPGYGESLPTGFAGGTTNYRLVLR